MGLRHVVVVANDARAADQRAIHEANPDLLLGARSAVALNDSVAVGIDTVGGEGAGGEYTEGGNSGDFGEGGFHDEPP